MTESPCPGPAPGTPWPCVRPWSAVQWGEHSEALYLTSSFVQPDCATAAAALPTKSRATPTAAPPTHGHQFERRLAAMEGTENAPWPPAPACRPSC